MIHWVYYIQIHLNYGQIKTQLRHMTYLHILVKKYIGNVRTENTMIICEQ